MRGRTTTKWVCVGVLCGLTAGAHALTLPVTTTNDLVAVDGVTSLREAIQAANLLGGPDTLDLPAGTYVLSIPGSNEDAAATGDLDVGDVLLVQGAASGPSIIQATAGDRLFHVLPGASLTLSNLNLTGGSGGAGGAVLNEQGDARLAGCALYGNSAEQGGAIFNAGTTVVFQCTLSDNLAGSGGGIASTAGVVELQHSTVAENGAFSGRGGGLSTATNVPLRLDHTLVAGNAAFLGGPDLDGTFDSLDYNLIGLTNGCAITNLLTHTITGVVAPLKPLALNGGPTYNRATVPGNLAIDAGQPAFAPPPADDQRGRPRVFNGRIDIGAYEFQFTNILVTTTNDDLNFLDEPVSLREAVVTANQQGATLNRITLPAGTYLFTRAGGSEDNALTGDLDFRSSVVVSGAGAAETVIDANGLEKVAFVDTGNDVTFADCTLRGGAASEGGGVYNQGTLRLLRCRLTQNEAFAFGGGIKAYSGIVLVDHSAIYENAAGGVGGGGIDQEGGLVVLTNSTVSGNFSGRGAGLYRLGGTLVLHHTTVAANQAVAAAGGLYSFPSEGDVVLANSVLADNVAPQEVDVAGAMTSFGYNFVEDYSNSTGYVDTDLGGGDPLLGDLAFNGGPTPTHAIEPGSALINRGDPAAPGQSAETDQRGAGFPRRRGLYIDMGAFEFPHPDEDGDGMPDEWEMEFGLDATNQLDAAGDEDDDRQPNLSEYIADTVPTNGDSFLHISEVAWAPGEIAVGFPSSTARVYRLQANTDLVFGAWQDVGLAVTGMVGSTTLLDSPAPAAEAHRISVRLP
jgi:hypothetical protein